MSSGGGGVGHDAKGNVNALGSRTFIYTSENRLADAAGTSLYYDAFGRLAHLTGNRTDLLYDGETQIMEVESHGGPIRRRYVHGPGVDEPLVEYRGHETSFRSWLYADERGSIIARANEHGNVQAVNRYDEYGPPASTNEGRFQYTGQKWLPELELYYCMKLGTGTSSRGSRVISQIMKRSIFGRERYSSTLDLVEAAAEP